MDANILYHVGATETSLTGIEAAIATGLMNRKTQYNGIIAVFARSGCEQADAMKELLQAESQAVEKLTGLLVELVRMLREAAAETGKVEDSYSVNRVKD